MGRVAHVTLTLTFDYQALIRSDDTLGTGDPGVPDAFPLPFKRVDQQGNGTYVGLYTVDTAPFSTTLGSLNVGQGVATSAGSSGYAQYGYVTVDVPAVMAAVVASSTDITSAAVTGDAVYTQTITAFRLYDSTAAGHDIDYSVPGLGCYITSDVQDYTALSGWQSGMWFSTGQYADPYAHTTTYTTAVSSDSTVFAVGAAPRLYPRLTTITSAAPMVAHAAPPTTVFSDGDPYPTGTEPVITGTIGAAALAAPFVLIQMDDASRAGAYVIPPGSRQALVDYFLAKPVLVLPVDVVYTSTVVPPLHQTGRPGVLDATEGYQSQLVTPQSSPIQSGML